MMTAAQYTIENLVKDFGYTSVEDFTRIQARNLLMQRIAYFQSRIDFFTKKYSMTYKEFEEKWHDLTSFGIIEKEDDGQDWETSLEMTTLYDKKLTDLLWQLD